MFGLLYKDRIIIHVWLKYEYIHDYIISMSVHTLHNYKHATAVCFIRIIVRHLGQC